MAIHETTFEFADRGATSVYKFRFPGHDDIWVWFEYAGGAGALFKTNRRGPYQADEELEPGPHNDLDRLLADHETTRERWIQDLMAQFGERLAWAYP